MKAINVFDLDVADHLIKPEEFEEVHSATPALALLTDFRHHRPHVVHSHMEALEAVEVMDAEDVPLKLVVDQTHDLLGVIARHHLNDDVSLLKALQLGVKRDELMVKDLMVPRSAMKAIDVEQLRDATVGDVVTALKKSRCEYLVVVNKNEHQIRGLISAHELSERMRAPVVIEKELTFADIVSAINVH